MVQQAKPDSNSSNLESTLVFIEYIILEVRFWFGRGNGRVELLMGIHQSKRLIDLVY